MVAGGCTECMRNTSVNVEGGWSGWWGGQRLDDVSILGLVALLCSLRSQAGCVAGIVLSRTCGRCLEWILKYCWVSLGFRYGW